MKIAVVILAAGIGKRMKSAKHKVLHDICGQPMIRYILSAVKLLDPERIVAVVGHQSEAVIRELGDDVIPAVQNEQFGTGHAVSLSEEALKDTDLPILVIPGDTPMITADTLRRLVDTHMRERPAATVLIAEAEDPFGYGRIIQGEEGEITSIIEERDAGEEERRIKLINGGIYVFERDHLFAALKELTPENDQGEFYLTDVIAVFNRAHKSVAGVIADEKEILGVNSRAELARAEALIQDEIKHAHMANGVTFRLPETSYIGVNVEIGRDTVIFPNTYIEGKTNIGEDCEIGPSTRINDTVIGSEVTIQFASVIGAEIEDKAAVGPFCSIRAGTRIKQNGKAGTFVELKNSEVGSGSKIPHLSYIGDTTIGEAVNVGAGSITCNYDGVNKWHTVIEDNVFIGSDTMLIAPVTIGRGAMTAAGSAISKDVPAGGLGIERSEQRNIENWAKKRRGKKAEGDDG